MDKWLTDLGLHEYWLNFKRNLYDNPKALEDLKVMNSEDLDKLLRDDLEIWKRGHVKKLTLAIRKLQYPSARMSNYCNNSYSTNKTHSVTFHLLY